MKQEKRTLNDLLDMSGASYGRLAAESVVRTQGTQHSRRQVLMASEVFMRQIIEQQAREQGMEAAAAFEREARLAFDARLAELDTLAAQIIRSDH